MKNDIVNRTQSTTIADTVRVPAAPSARELRRTASMAWLVGSGGILLVAISFVSARYNIWWSDVPFWVGLLALIVPVVLRILRHDITRAERIGLAVFLGVGLYLVKLVHSPQTFTFYDELLHWRTVADIQASGELFGRNPLLPISSAFPGMHSFTIALIELGGLSLFQAGVVVVLMARIVMCCSLYLLYERLSASPVVAGIGTVLYCANPSFLFFNGQYAYESFALALVPLVLLAQARLLGDPHSDRPGWYTVLWMTIGTIIVSHHLTTYFLLAVLLVWTLFPVLVPGGVAVLRAYGGEISIRELRQTLAGRVADLWSQVICRTSSMRDPGPARTLLIASAVTLLWAVFVAGSVFEYLGSYTLSSLNELFLVLIGELEARRLFKGFTGEVAPLWEQFAGYAAVLLVLGLLPLGLYRIWKQHRTTQLALTMGFVALAYPASQIIRFTDLGLQIAGRSVEFLFIPIAFVLAIWLANPVLPRSRRQVPKQLVAGAIITLFVGGIILGWPRWARMPRPYIVSAETRSVETTGLATAEWVRTQLPPDQRIAADRINGVLIGAYGDQYLVSLSYDRINIPQVYFAPQLDVDELNALDVGDIQYLVVDHRLSTSAPVSGVYFELGEPDANRHVTPIAASALDKFARLPFMSRVYTNGTIDIYAINSERLP